MQTSIARGILSLFKTPRRGRPWGDMSVARQRRELAELSDRQLQDIGLTRGQATREARRWFWDMPGRL